MVRNPLKHTIGFNWATLRNCRSIGGHCISKEGFKDSIILVRVSSCRNCFFLLRKGSCEGNPSAPMWGNLLYLKFFDPLGTWSRPNAYIERYISIKQYLKNSGAREIPTTLLSISSFRHIALWKKENLFCFESCRRICWRSGPLFRLSHSACPTT